MEPAGLFTEITAGLAAGSDLQALLQRFLEPLVRLSGAQAGAVRLLAGDASRFDLVGQFGLPEAVFAAERQVDRHCGVCGRAADEVGVVWGEDLALCAQRSAGAYFGASGCQRLLAVPLHYRDTLLGVYNLFFAEIRPPTPDVLAILKSVGELLGLALHHARLESEQRQALVMRERQAMAAEIHDSIAQTLTFVKMRLPMLEQAIEVRDDAHCRRYLGELNDVVAEAHASLRQILVHFRTQLPSRGLLPALQNCALAFRERTDIELELHDAAEGLKLRAGQEAQVFLIVQEALTNIARHSQARRAWVDLSQDASGVHVRIEDDGQGIAIPPGGLPEDDDHFGLQIMSERARRLGGRLDIARREAGGTCVHLVFPADPPRPAGRPDLNA